MKYKPEDIPEITIRRLSIYLQILKLLEERNINMISSNQLASLSHTNAVSIRKDLSYFGEFGKKHIGYNVNSLIKAIKGILKTDKGNYFIIIGYGNMGTAIAHFPGLANDDFILKGIFDNDENKIGLEALNGIRITDIKDIHSFLNNNNIQLAVLATPLNVAQITADNIINAGIEGILNMTGKQITVPKDKFVYDFNITTGFEWLSYFTYKKEQYNDH
jgi:redox-sensing transcriptional repressor